MTAISLICFVIWLYFLRVTYRSKLGFFTFVWGSVGLFVFMMLWLRPIVSDPFSQLVAYVCGLVGEATHLFESYATPGILFVPNAKSASISLYIDLECSGIIEVMAFTSMIWFFPVYKAWEKLKINLIAIVWIFGANILRVFIICLLVYFYGSGAFYMAHSIIGRLVFYALSIALYFAVFTKSQIIRQKVGGFSYAGDR